MAKHKLSILLLAGAIAFWLIFGIIIPDVFYGSPEDATKPVEHATAAVGQVLRKISPYLTLAMVGLAAARFFKELRK